MHPNLSRWLLKEEKWENNGGVQGNLSVLISDKNSNKNQIEWPLSAFRKKRSINSNFTNAGVNWEYNFTNSKLSQSGIFLFYYLF